MNSFIKPSCERAKELAGNETIPSGGGVKTGAEEGVQPNNGTSEDPLFGDEDGDGVCDGKECRDLTAIRLGDTGDRLTLDIDGTDEDLALIYGG